MWKCTLIGSPAKYRQGRLDLMAGAAASSARAQIGAGAEVGSDVVRGADAVVPPRA